MISIGTAVCLFKNKRKQIRKWSKRWLLDTNTYTVVILLRELITNETGDYQDYSCMIMFMCIQLIFPLSVSSWESMFDLPRPGISESSVQLISS